MRCERERELGTLDILMPATQGIMAEKTRKRQKERKRDIKR